MRSVLAFAGVVAVAFAGKTITETAVVDVTVTSCEAAPTDCNEWDDTSVPVEVTSTSTWGDAVVPTETLSWSNVVIPTTTPKVPVADASTWVEVPAPSTSVPAKPVASYTKSSPVAEYTGGAATLTGAGFAGVVAVVAMLL